MADWSTSPAWTAFEDINNGQRFTNRLSPEDFNKLAENIAYLYQHIGESEWLGEYVDGTSYKQGAIVSYYGDVYLCIKDLDDWQDPTNAEYWEMLNEEGGIDTWDGTGVVIAPIEEEPTTFTFTIGGTTYTAESGMTWYEWVSSDYAPDSYSCESTESNVYPTGDTYIADSEGNAVIGSTVIAEGGAYSIEAAE